MIPVMRYVDQVPVNARVLTLDAARELLAAGRRYVLCGGRVVEQRAAEFQEVLGTPWVRIGEDADHLLVTRRDAELLKRGGGEEVPPAPEHKDKPKTRKRKQ